MGAAKVLLDAGLEVTLYEEAPRLGGHCFAVPVPLPSGRGTVLIDAGVSDVNRATSGAVRGLLAELGLATQPVVHDTTCTTLAGAPVWTTRGGRRALGGIDDEARFFEEIDLFSATCVEVTAEARFSEWTAREYLEEHGYGPDFRASFFGPLAGGAFPMPDRDPEDYFIRPLVAYWQMEGTVGGASEERMVVEDGMHAWPAAFHIWFEQRGGRLRTGTRVVGISRRPRGIRLRLETHEGAHESQWFDHVVLAASPHASRSMIEDPTADEAALLGAFQWQRARVAVHRDASYVCSDPALIAACNYVIGEPGLPETRPTVTLSPRRLAGLPPDAPDVFVTINPHRAPRDIIANRFFVHPALARPTDVATRRLAELQGTGNTWFAGGWLRVPHVHEQALASGLDVGHELVAALSRPAASAGTGTGTGTVRRRTPRGYLDALRDSPIFASLDPCLLEEVRVTARPFEAAASEVLAREGDAASGLVLIVEGEAVGTRGGRHVARLGPGALVGEVSILCGGPSPVSCVARKPIAGWFFERAGIEQLRHQISPGAFAFLDQIARASMRVLREMIDRRFGPPPPAEPAPWTEARALGPAAGLLHGLALPDPARLRATLWELPTGMAIVHAGEVSRRFLIVTHGRITVTGPDGTPLVDAGPGDLPGVLAVFDGGRQPFTLVTAEPTIAAAIDADRFRELRYGGSALAANLVPRVHRYLVERYRPLLDAMLGDDEETAVDAMIY
jgi:predicted NAD/FAD-binding protein/CRP-like cAMP-binding protein